MGASQPETPTPVVAPGQDIGPALNIQAEAAEAQAQLAGRQLGLSKKQEGIAKSEYNRWLEKFKPVEQKLIKDAVVGVDPTRLEGRARADKMQQLGSAFQEGRRGLVSRGIVSDSPAQRALAQDIETAGGAEVGGAQLQARNVAEGLTDARRASVFGLGQGIPYEVVQGYGSATGVMGQAGGAMAQAAAQSAGAANTISEAQYKSGLMNAAYQNQESQRQYAQQMAQYQQGRAIAGGVGGLAGTWAGTQIGGTAAGPWGAAIGGLLGTFLGSSAFDWFS